MAQAQRQDALVAQHRAMVAVGKEAVKHSALTLAMHGIDSDQFAGVMVEALLANPDIARADGRALARAVRKCCQHAIIPDGDRGAIVMFGAEPVAMPMVQGLLQMATEDLEAHILSGVVHEGDNVTVIEGVGPNVDPTITSIPTSPSSPRASARTSLARGAGSSCHSRTPHGSSRSRAIRSRARRRPAVRRTDHGRRGRIGWRRRRA